MDWKGGPVTNFRTLLPLLSTLLLLWCPSLADVESPKVYEKDGIRFSYPGDWTLEEDSTIDGLPLLFVESSDSAIFVIFRYPPGSEFQLQEKAEEYSLAITKSSPPGVVFQSTGFKEVTGKVTGEERQGLREGVRLTAFGSSSPRQREYFVVQAQSGTALLVSQVSIDDLEEAKTGFQLIKESFRFSPSTP